MGFLSAADKTGINRLQRAGYSRDLDLYSLIGDAEFKLLNDVMHEKIHILHPSFPPKVQRAQHRSLT